MDKTKTTKLTQQYIKEYLTYDPDTGIFVRNERPLSHFKNKHMHDIWNTKWANKEITRIIEQGYIGVEINHRPYVVHRLAFLYMEGYFPENMVDHIDKNKLNNKWSNLREVGKRCNAQNCNLAITNTSGVTGVYWDKNRSKWKAQIMINDKTKNLGRFDNFEDAVRARYQEEVNNPEWSCSISSPAFEYLKDNNL